MTASFQRSTASGSTDTFPVSFGYLDQTHVKVYQDGVLLTVTTDYTWPDAANIQLAAGNPAAGTIIERRRYTPATALVDFEPGNLSSDDLDTANLQALYISEEARDLQEDLETRGWYTALYAAGGTVTKGASGELVAFDASGNMVGAGYTVTSLGAAVTAAAASAAAAAASAASTAADAISTAADAGSTATDAASTAADAIATAADRVQTGLDATATAADAVATAADAASTAADAISTAADAASTAADASSASASETNAASSLASFWDSFIGAAAGDPTNDLNGDPVSEGQLYWNTTSKIMKVHNGTAFEAAYLPASGYQVVLAEGAFVDGDKTALDGVVSDFSTLVAGVSASYDTLLEIQNAFSGYEPIDTEILRADTDDNLTAGYTATSGDDNTTGALASPYTPAPAGGNFKTGTVNSALTFNAPTASGSYTMLVHLTMGASAGAITMSGFTSGGGDSFTTTSGHEFFVHIRKSGSSTSYFVEALQ